MTGRSPGLIGSMPAPASAAPGSVAYRQATRKKVGILAGFTALLLLSLAIDVASGPAGYSVWEVLKTLFAPDSVPVGQKIIVWTLRFPVALMAIVTGAALAIAGAQMQTILNNPLASPFTLGLSAAAGFGAALAIVFGIAIIPFAGILIVPINAFVFAMLTALLIFGVSRMRGGGVETVVLLGIALVFTFNAALGLLQYLASEQALQEVVFWTLGSLAKATWTKVGITAAVVVLVIPYFVKNAWALTALRLGEDRAAAMGIDVTRLRLLVLMAASLLAAVPVAFVGTIGFVGLVGPHVARLLVGEDQRFFLPLSALAGALLLSLTSIISKSIVPGVLIPIGIITALVGVPFFLALILTNRSGNWK
ncbi:FecCD family ABC transporter permease [Lacibacterium aquatile]|uniref:FecCD family ABC transporter permease n=1 Tax=Lacibacterium aquatile TaxID=1168082 RepID=A0ABW5DU65_9PROT